MIDEDERSLRRTVVSDMIVSTVWGPDIEEYETGVLDAKNAYPVERYKTKEDAILGHENWVKKLPHLTHIIRLGCKLYGQEDKKITLIKMSKDQIEKFKNW